jgi:hypothetical protein
VHLLRLNNPGDQHGQGSAEIGAREEEAQEREAGGMKSESSYKQNFKK